MFRILFEEGLDGPEGWFSMPWKSGRSVVEMLLHIHKTKFTAGLTREEESARDMLGIEWGDPSMAYSALGEMAASMMTCATPAGRAEVMMAALRAAQIEIASSDGGGHTYNALLLNRWGKFEISGDAAQIAAIVRQCRCRDVVGRDPRRVAAFYDAWDARLYRAAHALG